MIDDEWTTTDELNFIENLGSFSTVKTPREELLKKYSKTIQEREFWCDINKRRISEEVKEIIEK